MGACGKLLLKESMIVRAYELAKLSLSGNCGLLQVCPELHGKSLGMGDRPAGLKQLVTWTEKITGPHEVAVDNARATKDHRAMVMP
ncbi:hypothetical protein RRG08_048292 [Elysia crispata]|uniref:Uncharacterized protein n=1 Tax=Elysia crispata TaxID=231223 RepID=A0AAE1DLP1_9GAST|nr:hypothetical protein RRG08_048292 [Elysia crispata]